MQYDAGSFFSRLWTRYEPVSQQLLQPLLRYLKPSVHLYLIAHYGGFVNLVKQVYHTLFSFANLILRFLLLRFPYKVWFKVCLYVNVLFDNRLKLNFSHFLSFRSCLINIGVYSHHPFKRLYD